MLKRNRPGEWAASVSGAARVADTEAGIARARHAEMFSPWQWEDPMCLPNPLPAPDPADVSMDADDILWYCGVCDRKFPESEGEGPVVCPYCETDRYEDIDWSKDGWLQRQDWD